MMICKYKIHRLFLSQRGRNLEFKSRWEKCIRNQNMRRLLRQRSRLFRVLMIQVDLQGNVCHLRVRISLKDQEKTQYTRKMCLHTSLQLKNVGAEVTFQALSSTKPRKTEFKSIPSRNSSRKKIMRWDSWWSTKKRRWLIAQLLRSLRYTSIRQTERSGTIQVSKGPAEGRDSRRIITRR